MKISIATVGSCVLITVCNKIKIITELTELKTVIEQTLAQNNKNIAVCFSDAQYLYSGALSVLISCYRMIKDNGGDLCIVEPHPKIYDLLLQMSIDKLIRIYRSLEDFVKERPEFA